MEFLEYSIYKINEALKSINGSQNREYHRLARFQHEIKNKTVSLNAIFLLPSILNEQKKKSGKNSN